jgi:hypothetical protein
MIDAELLADLRRLVNTLRLPEWQRDLINTCPDDLVKSIVSDNRSQPSSGGSHLPNATVSLIGAGKVSTPDIGPKYRPYQPPAEEPADRSGWRDAQALKPPEGLQHIDRMLDEEDRIWRGQRIKELAGASAAQRALAQAAAEAEAKDREAEAKAQEPKARGDKKA